ncbi:hypothetical protein ABZ783_13480 [Micromonospora sp. NPDC047738]|uniref:hypothetical protein n=1 Tax=Micromonospora sp. NPDC047738 TaxID=3155741 RepID=UPI0033C1858F
MRRSISLESPTIPQATLLGWLAPKIEIDHGNDEMGGVFVDWRPADALTGAVAESTMEGRPDAPAIQLFMAIATSMRDAMIGILHASGFNVVPVDDYAMRPPTIHVLR